MELTSKNGRELRANRRESNGSTNAQSPAEPWAQELKEIQQKLRCDAANVDGTPPSKVFHRLNWTTKFQRTRLHEFIKLTPEQQKMLQDLEGVTRASLRLSVLRESAYLDSLNHRPAHLDRRMNQSELKRKEIVAHAEKIALMGILDDQQAELVKRLIWKSNREGSFEDDELAARLRLTREQRQEIGRRMAEYKRAGGPPDIIAMPGTELAEKVDSEWRARVSAARQSLWDVLDPSQIERFERLIEPVSKF